MADKDSTTATLLVGPNVADLARGRGGRPSTLISVEASWDQGMQMWRADWEGGVAFGDSRHAAVLESFRVRLGVGPLGLMDRSYELHGEDREKDELEEAMDDPCVKDLHARADQVHEEIPEVDLLAPKQKPSPRRSRRRRRS
jgi:hypothetical protein